MGPPNKRSAAHSSRTNAVSLINSPNVASANIKIRMGFMRKVFGILASQILVTTIISVSFMMIEPVQEFVQSSPEMLVISLFGTFVSLLALMWKRHETPTNYILLGLFTIMEAYDVGFVVSFFEVYSVVEAFILTLGLTFGLVVYTLQSNRDFSSWHAPAVMALYGLVLASFIQIFFPVPAVQFGITLAGAGLFCIFIIVDVHHQMTKLSPEEYILAAINLYLDIINLFFRILELFGKKKE